MSVYTCKHKAQYYETDQMGIIHHSNYIRWFEEARTEFLTQAGYPYKELEESGIFSPVTEVTAKYHSMVHYGDTVTISASIESFNGIRLKIHYEIRDEATGELRTDGSSQHCFLDKTGKIVSLKRSYPDIYEKLSSL